MEDMMSGKSPLTLTQGCVKDSCEFWALQTSTLKRFINDNDWSFLPVHVRIEWVALNMTGHPATLKL